MRILRKNCLLKKVGFSKSTLSNRLNPSSSYYDETFPKPFPIGLSILGWDESEVDTWLESQKNNSRTPNSLPSMKVIDGTESRSHVVASNEFKEAA